MSLPAGGHMVRRRHGIVVRGTALLLSWVFTATTVWSAAPVPSLVPPLRVPLPSPIPVRGHEQGAPFLDEAVPGGSAPHAVEALPVDASAYDVVDLATTMLDSMAASSDPEVSGGAGASTLGAVGIFGPRRYVRTTGAKNVYTSTIAVPSWVVSPFTLSIQNGEPDGTHRVSSAWINVNGTQIAAAPADFNQNVASLERQVALTPSSTVGVTLASKPTSYLSLYVSGTSGDHTKPQVMIEGPAPDSIINDTRPRLVVGYRDLVGAGEPAASGIDVASLHVSLDGVDRTGLFARLSDQAVADLPAELALVEGPHEIQASIKDVAGNVGEVTARFRVDLTPPTVAIVEPLEAAYLPTLSPMIRIQYGDDVALDLTTLRISVDGAVRTTDFAVGPTEATATLELPAGGRQVTAEIRDRAGNRRDAARRFNLDISPPVLTIAQPQAGSHHGSSSIEILIQYSDDQRLDQESFEARVDGNLVTLGRGPEGASGVVAGRSDGPHVVSARIRDAAGNETTPSQSFSVDTTAPAIQIVQPPPGQILPDPTPSVVVAYSDAQDLDLPSFRLWVGPVERTAWCAVGADGARCAIPEADRLPEGPNAIRAEITDLTGNTGRAGSDFTVDTIAPTGTFDAPAAPTHDPKPIIQLAYSDGSGSGIDTASVKVFVDGQDRTSSFAIGPVGVTGSLPETLADGSHTVAVHVADRAGNEAPIPPSPATFVVDTLAPTGGVTQPASGSFINDPTPTIVVSYGDGAGSGVILSSVKVFIQKGTDAEQEITAHFQIGPTGSTGTLPEAARLEDGTYHLRVALTDAAGNEATLPSSFEIDTVAPTYHVQTPADGAYVPSRTPAVLVTYADDRSGIDTGKVSVLVDTTDVTGAMTIDATRIVGTVPADDALAEGPHTLAVAVFDRAGNRAQGEPQTFTVDTIAPAARLEAPGEGAYLGSGEVAVRFAYEDLNGDAPDSSVDPASVRVFVDNVDRTADFAVTATSAEGTVILADAPHAVRVEVTDWADNPGTAGGGFTIDTLPPALTIAAPAEGSYHKHTPIAVSGTIVDADPELTVECQAAGEPVAATVGGGTFTCTVPLSERVNTIRATGRDRLAHQGEASPRTVTLDTIPPQVAIVQPPDGTYTSAAAVDVSGSVTDESPVTVAVDGIAAAVTGTSFSAAGIPLGEGSSHPLHALAEDAAGNTGEASTTVLIDRVPPLVSITSPTTDTYLRGPLVDVQGTVSDTSPTAIEVNGQLGTVTGPPQGATFTASVPVVDGRTQLVATAVDAAANRNSASVWVNVDSVSPVITITEPTPGLVTNKTNIRVAGTVSDASPFTLRLGGSVVPVSGGAFEIDVPLGAEGQQVITLSAEDAAGNQGGASVPVTIDRTPPVLAVLAPDEGTAVGSLPVGLVGTVTDATETTVTVDGDAATRTGEAWQASILNLAEGPHSFQVVARDAAGNETPLTRNVVVDLGPPVVTITSPPPGTLTRETAVTVTGVVEDRSTVMVSVNGVSAAVTGTGPFSFTAGGVPLLQEADNALVATATDLTRRTGEDSVVVTRDTTPPDLELITPEKISRGRPGTATAVVSDNLGGPVTVTFRVDNVDKSVSSAPPYSIPLTVPDGATAGQAIVVEAVASDAAGNARTVSHGVRVVSDGVVVGQALADETGLPLPGATVRMITSSGQETVVTDEKGRYTFPTSELQALVTVAKPGMTVVERQVPIESGFGTVPVDSRLTTLATPIAIDADGGTLTAGRVTVSVPAGAAGEYGLTAVSPQGLADLLPLGWSPVAAFVLTGPANGPPLAATAAGLPALSAYLVTYGTSTHNWRLVTAPGAPTDGTLAFKVPGSGAFAVVVLDDDTVAVPAAGEPLAGVEFQSLPVTATSQSTVTPQTLAPSGGTARGALSILSPVALPSGTVVQAEVRETFTLASGDVASEEVRRQDIVLYRHPAPEGAALAAEIPITPARTFTTTELVEGKVHLDILAGREGVRGTTGGLEAVTLEAGDLRLGVAAQSLADDTAIALEQTALSAFLPSSTGLIPLAEAVVDFAGQRLGFAAELSAGSLADPDGSTLLVARVERLDGVPHVVVVAFAELVDGRVVTVPTPGLPGIREGGRYVFYRSAVPLGFVAGTVTPVAGRAVVAMTGLGAFPFIALTETTGQYRLVVPAGPVALVASLPRTALQGQAQTTVEAGQTAPLDIALVGSATTATVTPAEGAVVPPNTQITLVSETPLSPSTINATNIHLGKKEGGAAVGLRFVLSGSGKNVSIVPTPAAGAPADKPALDFSSEYVLEAAGLKTTVGGDVLVPTVTFRTKDDVPPVYDTTALTFSFPDAEGNVTITAPPGSFPPGTQILVLNSGNGFVATFTAENDGAVGTVLPATMPASIDDFLIVTITDPNGNVTTVNRSKFVDPATGRTAIGPGGGVVEATDGSGVELRIPDGALDKGVTLKIEGVTADQLQQLFPDQAPDLPGATLGSGLKVTSEDKPDFNKEAKLAFPVPPGLPGSPTDAFFYVYRRVTGPEGQVFFETIDHAFIECPAGQATCAPEEQKVVTASYPFAGFVSTFASFDPSGAVLKATQNYAFLVWTFDTLLPGKALSGVITGKVLRTKWDPGAQTPTYEPIKDAVVRGQDAGRSDLAVSQKDGTFTLFDARYTGGTVTIQATVGGETRTATAFEANPADWSTSGLRFYKNVASANITFPPIQPPPPPPDIRIQVMRLVNGIRTDTGGLVVANVPLVIGVAAKNGSVQTATLQGKEYGVRLDPLKGQPGGMDFVLDPDFTPTQPGSYTVTATALPAFGSPVTGSYTFRVLAEGGGVDTLPDDPPRVITAKTVPKWDASGVPVTVFPQVAFTEPVRNVPGNLRLVDPADTPVPLRLSGVAPGGVVVDDLTRADTVVTSLTIQPLTGLRYGTLYRLILSDGIQDLDTDSQGSPAPKSLVPYETKFTTFGPQALTDPGTGETFTSPGIVVLGERAYLVQNNFFNGVLRGFDVSDPVSPREIESARATVTWRPVDLAGEEEAAISQGRLITVATSSTNVSKPSNVYLFDATSDQSTQWIGAVSLTSSAVEGFINRITTKNGFLYAATAKKGIQVVDLAQAKALFELPGTSDYWKMVQSFNTDGQGFGQGAVVQTIPVNDGSGKAQMLRDLKVGDFLVDGQSQVLVVATGDAPLVVVNPQMGAVVAKPSLTAADGSTLTRGEVLALGTIDDRRIAVVVGAGTTPAGSATVLAVVSLDTPTAPQVMSIEAITGITGPVTDVLLKDSLALVGTTKEVALVSLQDLSRPTMVGVLQNVAGRLALTSSNLLLSSARSVFGGSDALGGVRSATLGTLPLIQRPPVFAVDRKQKSLEPNELKLQVVPASTEVETAALEVYQDGNLVRAIPLPAFTGGSTTYTLPKGSDFSADSRYQARLVINKGLGEKELFSSKQNLRPARFDILGTEEVTLVQGKDPVDVLTMYNSAPEVTVTFKNFSGVAGLPLGAGDNVSVNVEGTVKSSVAAIEKVVVNENVVAVTPTGSGTQERGPFTGRYSATVEVGPQAELVTAYAVDALTHVSTQSLAIYPRERILGVIPGRDVVSFEPLVPGPTDGTPYQFRVELKDKGSSDSSAKIEVLAGVETKTLTLKREGDVFRSEPLLALPESLKLPASATDPVKSTRLMVRLGTKPQLKYGTVEAKAIVSGVALVPAGPVRVADFVDPASGQGYVIEVGAAGTSGNSLSATVTSLGGRMEALDAGADPTSQGFAIAQVSADPEDPSFNLYRATGSDALLAVMDGIQTSGSGKRQRVVPFGRLKVTAVGQDLMLPVGAGADRVRWETLEVRPLYAEGLLDSLFSFLTGPALPKWWQVTQAATFLRGDTPIPGLRVSGFLDRRTRLVDEDSGITAVVPQGDAWTPVTFPQLSDADGKIRFRVKATAVDEGSTQPLAGVVLALTDVVGIRAIGLLGTGTGGTPPLPAIVDVSSEHGKEYKATPIVAGFVSAGGLPRRHNEWYKRLSRLVVEQVVGNDPQLLGIKQRLAAGLTARGIAYTAEQLEEYYVFFMLGAMVGFPRGAVGAFKDSVVGVYDLVGSVGPLLKFLAPKTGTEAVLQLTFAPLPGGVLIAKGVLGAQYVLENREKLQKLLPLLEKAAEFLGREEIQAQLTASLANSVLGNYQQELGKLVGYFGMTEGSLGYRPLVLGYSVGAIGGYFTEFGVELVGATLVGEGVGAALPVMLKAGRIPAVGGRVAAAMKAASRLALAGGDGSKLARGFSFLVKFLDALGPNVLERWMLRIAEVEGGPERMFALLIKYGETADAELRLVGIAKGLTGDVAGGARGVENVVETLVTMQKMAADAEYRGTRQLVIVSAESAEDFAKAVGQAVDLSKAEPELLNGFEAIFKNVDEVEAFLAALAGGEDDAFRSAARLACPR